MNFSTAFDNALTKSGVSARWLAQQSGVTEAIISRFRNGTTNPTTKTLEQLLSPLSIEVQQSFYENLLGQSLKPCCPSAVDLVKEMESTELVELLNIIATRLSIQQKSQEKVAV